MHPFYFLLGQTISRDIFWRGENINQMCIWGHTGSKKNIFRGHVVKVIQGHVINVKIELLGSLCVKTRR